MNCSTIDISNDFSSTYEKQYVDYPETLLLSKEEKREHGNYNQACLSAKIQYAIISSQKKITDDPLYGKIKKMLAKDLDTMNPLSQIIEHDIYDGLSNAGKEKYMFKLSKRYATIKEHILGESSKDE